MAAVVIERTNTANTPEQGSVLPLVGNRYAVTPLGQEFLRYSGSCGLWLADQPMQPDHMNASIALWDESHWSEQSNKIDHILVPYNGSPMMSYELLDEFEASSVEIHPVQLQRPRINRPRQQTRPDNLITVSYKQVDAIAEEYRADNKRYSILRACGWPTLVAAAGLEKANRRLEGNIAIFGSYKNLPSEPPRPSYMPQTSIL